MEKVIKKQFKYLLPESYLAYIKNSVGTQMFRNFFVIEKGKKRDVLQDGNLSCAVFVSTILRNFGLINKLHFTVGKTVEDMASNHWQQVKVSQLRPGDVLIWSSKEGLDGQHNHIGFYLGGTTAVSNSEKQKKIIKHHFTFNRKRPIELAYRPRWKKSYAKS